MKRTYIYTLIIFILTAGLCLADDVNIAELVKNHPAQADFPHDESVILYESVHYILDAEGKVTLSVHRLRTLFNENSVDHYGDPVISYYEDGQELEVAICRAYMLDGSQVDTWGNGLNQITPFALGSAPDYTGFQQMVATHTGLEWGGTSELKYTVRDKMKVRGWMEGIEYFQSDEYIMYKEVKVTVPENIPLHFQFLNGEGEMNLSVKEGMRTRVWTMKNIPHILHDDAYPFRMKFTPTLIFSTCPDWKFLASYFTANIDEAARATELLQTDAQKVIEDRTEDYFIINELSKLVRNRVRTVNYHEDIFPWHHRNAERTLSSAYGNAFDKAILLTALLKIQGLPAEIALSADVCPGDFSVPMLSYFDNFWVITRKNSEELFLDPLRPLSLHSRKDIAGGAVFRFNYSENAPQLVPPFTMEDNKIILNIKLMVEDDGSYTGSGYFRASGYFSPFYAAVSNSEGVTGWLKGNFSGILPGLEVTGGSAREIYTGDCKFTFDFEGESLGEFENGYLMLEIPQIHINLEALEPSSFHPFCENHSSPVFFKGIGRQIANITIEYPENWSVVGSPGKTARESSLGSVLITESISNNKIELSLQRSFNEPVIHPDYFPLLKDLYFNWEKRNNQYLIFKQE